MSRSRFQVFILLLVFFVISLLTNVIGPLVPDLIRSFQLSLTMAAFLPFSFFVAYAVMSIPSGILIEKFGEKPVMLGAFTLALIGSLLFSMLPSYRTASLSLFLIGLGMASLQVAINPLLRVVGGEEHYAFNAVLVQFVFGIASFLSPLLYIHVAPQMSSDYQGARDLLGRALACVVPPELPFVAMYWIFSVVTVAMILLIAAVSFPRVERTQEERVGAWSAHRDLLEKPVVWLFFLGVLAYVGLEQGLSYWMSQFLAVQHGYDPQTQGATAVSRFWGLMTVGCLLGLVLLKFFDSRHVLVGFSAATLVALGLALFGTRQVSWIAFPVTGFTLSVMWSIIFSLALNSLAEHHGTFSGLLCTGIVGGALVPLLIGSLGDHLGLRAGLCFLFLPTAYIFSIGLWARPLITNQRLGQ